MTPYSKRDLFKLVGKIGLVSAAQVVPWHVLDRLGLSGSEWVAEAASMPQNYVVRTPTLITDFSSTTGMTLTQGTGSVALDTAPPFTQTGTGSLKITQLASESSALVDLDCRNAAFGGTGSDGFNGVADNLWHLRSYIDTPNNQNTVSIFPSNTAGGFADYFASTAAPSQISTSSNWTNLLWDRVENRKDWTAGGGSPSHATTIKTLRIRPSANANGTLTTWLDALYRGGYARPKILITFDDSNDQQYNIARPIMDEFGFKGTFYCIADPIQRNVGGSFTEAMADALYAQGHDLAFHQWLNTYNNYSELTSAQLAVEVDNWLSYAGSKGWVRAIRHLAYPQGVSSGAIREVLTSRRMITARSTIRLKQHHLLGLAVPLGVTGWSWDAADGTAGPISWMNDAVTYGSTINIAFHQFHATTTTGAQINAADFRAILLHAYRLQQSNLADVMTVSQWYNGLAGARRPRA